MTRTSTRARLREFLDSRRPERIDSVLWAEMLAALAPVKESYLRELTAEAGIPVDQPYAGVRQHTLEELETSLIEMGRVYTTGHGELARRCRLAVIEAKDRAKWASRSERVAPAKRALKAEMANWMLVWLDDPAMFPAWAAARKRTLEEAIRPGDG